MDNSSTLPANTQNPFMYHRVINQNLTTALEAYRQLLKQFISDLDFHVAWQGLACDI